MISPAVARGMGSPLQESRSTLPTGLKMLGQRLASRYFDRQIAEVQVRVAVLNGFTARGYPSLKSCAKSVRG